MLIYYDCVIISILFHLFVFGSCFRVVVYVLFFKVVHAIV